MLTCLGGFGKPTNPASKLLVAVVTHGEISDPNHSKVCVLFCFVFLPSKLFLLTFCLLQSIHTDDWFPLRFLWISNVSGAVELPLNIIKTIPAS